MAESTFHLFQSDPIPHGNLLFSTPLEACEHIAPHDLQYLNGANIFHLGELFDWFPKRHEDRKQFEALPNFIPSSTPLCLRGKIIETGWKYPKSGKVRYFEITIADTSSIFGKRFYCRWFGMAYISRVFAVGMDIILYGKAKMYGNQLYFSHPDFEILSGEGIYQSIHLDRIVPIYRTITGISPHRLREILFLSLEALDINACQKENLRELYPGKFPRIQAIRDAHFPETMENAKNARRYFALEEALEHQLALQQRKKELSKHHGRQTAGTSSLVKDLAASLPFELTSAQKQAVREIYADMKSLHPMNRLLQGDVGSGKTLVAICAMLLATESGFQSAFMAPTQILAEQHYQTLSKFLANFDISIALRTSDKDFSISNSKPQIIVGTHALLHHPELFNNLGLIVIDEQHKFGVDQRAKLVSSGTSENIFPDVLVMTATPIPRTLTLTFYGEMEISILDQRPAGRGKIVTAIRKHKDLAKITQFILSELENNRQAYIISPLVEESESSTPKKPGKKAPKAAISEWEEWKKRLPNFEVGLIHGRMSADEKEQIMQDFRKNKLQVLVATTVVEVGVDVPNANIMIINNAERFGLAQLHQLRGRIGRGKHNSWCILMSEAKPDDENFAKLEIMQQTCDGFEIAEADLKLRGPGELLGTSQAGLKNIRFEDWILDARLIHEARILSERFKK